MSRKYKVILSTCLSFIVLLAGLWYWSGSNPKIPTERDPMTIEMAVNGDIKIYYTAYMQDGSHGHGSMTILSTSEEYQAWVSHFKIKPGQKEDFLEWPKFYLDKFSLDRK